MAETDPFQQAWMDRVAQVERERDEARRELDEVRRQLDKLLALLRKGFVTTAKCRIASLPPRSLPRLRDEE